MKPALRDRITASAAINLTSVFTPAAQNRPEIDPFSFRAAARHRARSRISCFPSLRTSVSPCRGAHTLAERRFARMHVAAAFFLPAVPSLKSMQIFHEARSISLFSLSHPLPLSLSLGRCARPLPSERKKPALFAPSDGQAALLSAVALFSFCRRCPTWRYVKRIYKWRYETAEPLSRIRRF